MVIFKNNFSKIYVLVCFLTQNCYSIIHTTVQQNCIDEIKKVFQATDMVESRKTFASQAYLHLKISDDDDQDTFKNRENNSIYVHAKEYYKHILKPGFLRIGAHMKLPEKYCQAKLKEYTKKPKKTPMNELQNFLTELTKNVFDVCMDQLESYGISLSNVGLDVIRSIYENVVIDKVLPEDSKTFIIKYLQELQSNRLIMKKPITFNNLERVTSMDCIVLRTEHRHEEFVKEFIKTNDRWFQADPPMKLPQQFCMDAFPTHTQFDPDWKPRYHD